MIRLYRKLELINTFMEELGYRSIHLTRTRDNEGMTYLVDGLQGFYHTETRKAVSFKDAQKLLSSTVFFASYGVHPNAKVCNPIIGNITLGHLLEALGYGVAQNPLVLSDLLGGYKGIVYSNRKRKIVDQANYITLEVIK